MNAKLIATSTARFRLKFLHRHFKPTRRNAYNMVWEKACPQKKEWRWRNDQIILQKEKADQHLCGQREDIGDKVMEGANDSSVMAL